MRRTERERSEDTTANYSTADRPKVKISCLIPGESGPSPEVIDRSRRNRRWRLVCTENVQQLGMRSLTPDLYCLNALIVLQYRHTKLALVERGQDGGRPPRQQQHYDTMSKGT